MIVMLGTDHTLAGVEERSQLYLTKERRVPAMRRIRDAMGADGLVMLSTCNRMELWACIPEGAPGPDAFRELLCAEVGVDTAAAGQLLAQRLDEEAVEHLFHLACGLRSAIMAEDQIVTQVRQAIDFSREHGLACPVLEALFRRAVTAAKKVKTDVRFTRADGTAVDSALSLLEARGHAVRGGRFMVIGNGTYGRLAASALRKRGAEVLVTVRQYHRGRVAVPEGCTPVPYGERYRHMAGCTAVVSATTSPHFTIEREELGRVLGGSSLVLVDMAIPRDVDPACSELAGVELFDIDDFQTGLDAANSAALVETEAILSQEMKAFWDWEVRRAAQPALAGAYERAYAGMAARIRERVAALPLSREQKDELLEFVSAAAGRLVLRSAYDLQDQLEPDDFGRTLDALGR